MIYSPTSKPEGTIRDWLNYHAKTSPNKVSYQFSDNGSELTWLELLNRVKLITNHLLQLNIRKGDLFLLCSDGLTKELNDSEIMEVLSENTDIEAKQEELISQTLSKGARDNTSVILIQLLP